MGAILFHLLSNHIMGIPMDMEIVIMNERKIVPVTKGEGSKMSVNA